jgi:hypothetical protein
MASEPIILGLNPVRAQPGDFVAIRGRYLTDVQEVRIGDVVAPVLYNTARELVTQVPDGAKTAPVRVTTASGAAVSARPLTITVQGPDIDDKADDFDVVGLIQNFAQFVPQRHQPVLRQAAHMARAAQTLQSAQMARATQTSSAPAVSAGASAPPVFAPPSPTPPRPAASPAPTSPARGGPLSMVQGFFASLFSSSAPAPSAPSTAPTAPTASPVWTSLPSAPPDYATQSLNPAATRRLPQPPVPPFWGTPSPTAAPNYTTQPFQPQSYGTQILPTPGGPTKFMPSGFSVPWGAMAAGGAGGYALGQMGGGSGIGGAVGGAAGALLGPVGSVVGAVVGTIIDITVGAAIKAARKTVGNIRQSGDLGADAVTSVTSGIKTAGTALWAAGASIADTIVQGALRSFGPSGASVAQFTGQMTRTVGSLLSGVFDLAAAGARGAGRAGGLVVGAAGAAVGIAAASTMAPALAPMGLAPLGLLAGALIGSAVGVAAMKVIKVVADLAGSIVGTLGKAFGELGGLVAGAIRTVMDVLDDARKSLLSYATAVNGISTHSGMGIAQSEKLVQTRQAFGMNSGETSRAYSAFDRLPMFQSALKAAWGIGGEIGSEKEFRSILDRARSLPLLMRRTMLQSMPEGEDFWLRLVGMPQGKINSQLAFFRNMDMGSGAVKAAAEDLTLLQDRWGGFVEFLKRTLGQAFLPVFTRALTTSTNYLKTHQQEVVAFVMEIGRWFYVVLPELMLKGAVAVINTVGWMVKGIGTMLGGIKNSIKPILDFLDTLLQAFRSFAANAAGALAVLAFKMTPAGKIPIVGDALALNAGRIARNRVLAAIPEKVLSDQNFLKVRGAFARGESTVKNWGRGVDSFAANFEKQARAGIGSEDDRQKQFDDFRAMREDISTIARNSEKPQKIDLKIAIEEAKDALYRIAAFISEDAFLDASR